MLINVRFLDNLKLEASFDDFKVIADQPIRYKGDGSAPGPFDYFLASSALCAAYFVKVYCNTRGIPTEDIRISQNNFVDPENRYHQDLQIQIEVPDTVSEKDLKGMIASMERCTVKRVIQNNPKFVIEKKEGVEGVDLATVAASDKRTMIIGKDSSLEETITKMSKLISDLGINIEIASWRNQIPHVWSVHIRDADSPICFSNGKGASKDAALCSALGEFIERLSNNYFYSDYYLGKEIAEADFVHYPNEKWFSLPKSDEIPDDLMDDTLKDIYQLEGDLKASHLIDTNSGNTERGICALPYERQSDKKTVYIPVNLIGNLFVSNGMSAGNSKFEARVQCLSEIFERAIKNQIITQEITLPDVPQNILEQYPNIVEGIKKLEEEGFPIVVKDASLGGIYPVMCVTLLNPRTGGVFASFGAHPNFEVALERSLTELLQGRSFEGMNDVPPPTFNTHAVTEHNNIIDHFIDSTGVISWKFFNNKSDYDFVHWNFSGTTEEEFNYLMDIFNKIEKEVYIADYEDLGASACRILVPEYSEIYLPEDLIWDNNNQAIKYRERILTVHNLSDKNLKSLVSDLEESGLDNFGPISELIGIAFDENSNWGKLTVGELKAHIYLALGYFEDAKELVEQFITFNDSTDERRKFYQILNILLDISVEDHLDINDYYESLSKMYDEKALTPAIQTINGEVKFYGLSQTDPNLTGLEKHLKLIESYQKLQKARALYQARE